MEFDRKGQTMNERQINTMLNNMENDYIGMGRMSVQQDKIIIETIMRIYSVTDWLDWEECKYLFSEYVEKGILDFPTAKKMAMERQNRKVVAL